MASLTPLSKGLIGLAVVGAMASAVWHLGLKEKVQDAMGTAPPTTEAPAVQATPPAAPAVVTTQAPATTRPQSTPLPANTAPASASGMTAADNAEAGRKLLESGNPAQARIHLEQAVQGGDASAACLLGDHQRARGLWEALARGGDDEARRQLDRLAERHAFSDPRYPR